MIQAATPTVVQPIVRGGESSSRTRHPPLPGLIFNTLPKSGSVFIARTLAEGLGVPLGAISHGYFPADLIDFARLRSLAEGNALTQAHFDASPTNLQLLGRFCDRIVVHVRDPRPALFSWVHHLNRIQREGQDDFLLWVCPTPPADYYRRSLEEQIDWNLAHYLPSCVRWIEGWLSAIDRTPGLRVLVTRYEDFVQEENAFLERILRFYDIPQERFRKPSIAKTLEVNYRQGEAHAWRRHFTPKQQTRALELIPARLLERFDWAA